MLVGVITNYIGIPPLIYGAGLNLFNMRFFAYLIHRLGVYKVDRRKKNIIYLHVLEHYTKEIIKHGCHVLFFPNGTRSRSGSIEKNIKLGLLGTLVNAQRELYEDEKVEGGKNKIYVVPVVLNYHFVLEATNLIYRYLQKIKLPGYNILSFILRLLFRNTTCSVSFAPPMDVVGNKVDEKGCSYDEHGRKVDVADYFMSQGKVAGNEQRESEYTRHLSKRIMSSYFRYTEVLSSQLVSFAAFEQILKQYAHLDVYDILRMDEKEFSLDYATFLPYVDRLRAEILARGERKEIYYEAILEKKVEDIVKAGIAQCGIYHPRRSLYLFKGHSLRTQDIKLLYYYHNRLKGYGLQSVG